jgi:FtsP/CotA-like multicopper oxidase with cupredoxin domain
MVTRRNFLKSSAALSALASLPLSIRWSIAQAQGLIPGLSDPALQPMFMNPVPDALDPTFKYTPDKKGRYKVQIREAMHDAGLVDPLGNPVLTPIFGYTDSNVRGAAPTWPGKTFEVQSGPTQTEVKFQNRLEGKAHLLPVDTNLHWCYSLPGYENFTIANNGVPTITHLHGGHSDFQYDGNPEFFSNPYEDVLGPQWGSVPGGFTTKFRYDNNVRAGNLWYHDHALGITRLNVYAGLAGFYFVRDAYDTGQADNPLGLPAWPYEKAYAIQDRMFRDTGELFYPSMPGDPFYEGFITEEGAVLDPLLFPGGGPTALAEFFGDHMVVNGKIWPKEDVEQRHYRLRLLNGTDSRFMGLRFWAVPDGVAAGATELPDPETNTALFFDVIGSDQGLASSATSVTQLVFEPGSRYDVVIDFAQVPTGTRVIMENFLGDEPFGGSPVFDLDDQFPDRRTDRIMAFDVVLAKDMSVADNYDPSLIAFGPTVGTPTVTRKVALFEGKDEFGRLQPLLGAYDDTVGEFRAIPWHMGTTENPVLGATEEWEIYNFTGDAHPVHLHLVHFEILGRSALTFDADDETNPQIITQHNGATGMAPRVSNVVVGAAVPTTGVDSVGPEAGYVENCPKDMVTCLPDQVTRIKATFDKPGRYVWHCHILSHEDHEMMRVMHVGPGA